MCPTEDHVRVLPAYLGQHVADFTSYNLHDPSEYCDVIYTTIYNRRKLTDADLNVKEDPCTPE
jgi:hypothetical protein